MMVGPNSGNNTDYILDRNRRDQYYGQAQDYETAQTDSGMCCL